MVIMHPEKMKKAPQQTKIEDYFKKNLNKYILLYV